MDNFQLDGMDQLLRRISEMGLQVSHEIEEKALVEGAKIIRDAGEAKAPKLTGNLKANIIASKVKNGKIDIGPDQQGNAFYGYFLEFGRSAGTKKTGSKKGYNYPAMPPHPFMQPAFEENVHTVQQEMAKVIKRELRL
jgi:HK97 gp10 family phage protein